MNEQLSWKVGLTPIQIAVIACLPGLPLVFLVMPVGDLLKLLAGALV